MTGGDGSAAADSVMTDDAGLVVPLQYVPLLQRRVQSAHGREIGAGREMQMNYMMDDIYPHRSQKNDQGKSQSEQAGLGFREVPRPSACRINIHPLETS